MSVIVVARRRSGGSSRFTRAAKACKGTRGKGAFRACMARKLRK